MSTFAQLFVSGAMLGGIYALMAIGLTLIFGVLKVVNFAHGEFLMLAMYFAWALSAVVGLSPYASIVLVVPLMIAFGVVIYALMVRPAIPESPEGPEDDEAPEDEAARDAEEEPERASVEEAGKETGEEAGAHRELESPDRYRHAWSAVYGILAVVLLATAALRDAGWVLAWTLIGAFFLASLAFAVHNPAARRSTVGVAAGSVALLRNALAVPVFLGRPLARLKASNRVVRDYQLEDSDGSFLIRLCE
jgi:hypothetical protein